MTIYEIEKELKRIIYELEVKLNERYINLRGVAESTRIPYQLIWRFKMGYVKKPNLDHIKRLCKHFNIAVGDL